MDGRKQGWYQWPQWPQWQGLREEPCNRTPKTPGHSNYEHWSKPYASANGYGSKMGIQNGTLVNKTKDESLRSPSNLILTHTQMLCIFPCRQSKPQPILRCNRDRVRRVATCKQSARTQAPGAGRLGPRPRCSCAQHARTWARTPPRLYASAPLRLPPQVPCALAQGKLHIPLE